jgi:hypothetical protein
MRRAIASSLLTIVSVLLIAPFFALDPQASLPPCCRTHGKHRCMMMQRGVPDRLAHVSERCVLFPKCGGAAISRCYKPEQEQQLQSAAIRLATPPHAGSVRRQRPVVESHPKRGPPAFFA